jgi:hypothetical protein
MQLVKLIPEIIALIITISAWQQNFKCCNRKTSLWIFPSQDFSSTCSSLTSMCTVSAFLSHWLNILVPDRLCKEFSLRRDHTGVLVRPQRCLAKDLPPVPARLAHRSPETWEESAYCRDVSPSPSVCGHISGRWVHSRDNVTHSDSENETDCDYLWGCLLIGQPSYDCQLAQFLQQVGTKID